MVFSSVSFLFFFLPILLLVYYAMPKSWRNAVLLAFSLAFYFMGEKWYVLLLVLSCIVNYGVGLAIEKRKAEKVYLALGLVFDIGLLFYFKYTNFFWETFRNLFGLNGNTLKIVLPLGISFFTFQNISYLIDVYRSDVKAERNVLTYMTYITLFPQLVAGPIVRYKDIREQLSKRHESFELFAKGVRRFVIGLGKKVLIADVLYKAATSGLANEGSTLGYWVVAILFTLQIYYDFSGYSDMAIGLGYMFGFEFCENFDYPLVSKSVTEFWRRWHMSLSSFYRDYVYIPLGGSRCSKWKHVRNVFIVWSLTGLWHGADWNFVLWGLYFFVFLLIEKFFLKKKLDNPVLAYVYTGLVILVSFVIFNMSDLGKLGTFLLGMVGAGVPLVNVGSVELVGQVIIVVFLAVLGMGPWLKRGIENLRKGNLDKVFDVFEVACVLVVLVFSVGAIVANSFKPFIYFRF